MMNAIARTTLTIAAATLVPLTTLAAQEVTTRHSAASEAEQLRTVDPVPIWNYAQLLRTEGLMAEARREFQNVARVLRSRNESAADALWMIAEIEYAQGNRRRAGQALDQVAREAERYGNADLQARALFEAAVMYGRANDTTLAALRLQRLEGLLSDAEVSGTVRALIEQRMELT